MKITGFWRTCSTRGPRPPQFKFKNLFNKHFVQLIFFFFFFLVKSISSDKNWRDEL